MDVGVGVARGPVWAGQVGAASRLEYTVIGDPVNEAARLTELAKNHPGRVVASQATVVAAAKSEQVRWQPDAEVQLRGRESSRAPGSVASDSCASRARIHSSQRLLRPARGRRARA